MNDVDVSIVWKPWFEVFVVEDDDLIPNISFKWFLSLLLVAILFARKNFARALGGWHVKKKVSSQS